MARLTISVRTPEEFDHTRILLAVVEKVTPAILRKMFPDVMPRDIQNIEHALSIHHLDLSRLNRAYAKQEGME